MIAFSSAEQRDLPLLFAMNKTLIDEYEDISAIDYDRVLAWVKKNLEKNLPHFRRIEVNAVTAGFFCLNGGELDSLFILPEFRGNGIGSEVIRYCQQTSPALFLYVFKRNLRATELYRRLGFTITKDVGRTRCIMEWKNQNL